MRSEPITTAPAAERPLVVLGAGGHGKVVADILLAMGLPVAGFLDPGTAVGQEVLGLPVLGADDWLERHAARVALGLGENGPRARLAAYALERGAVLVSAVHPRAVVAASARLGEGVVLAALAVVNASAVVERGAIVNTGAIVEHDCVVGEFAHLATHATTGGACTIGRLALLGSGATMLPGTELGESAIVGSQALVTRDVVARRVVKGVPAR